MANTNVPYFLQSLGIGPVSFANADSANTKKTLVTGGTNTSKVVAVTATNTDGANAYVAQLWLVRSSTAYLLTSVNIPVNSGSDGTAAGIDIMNALFAGLPISSGSTGFEQQSYIPLQANDLLQVSLTTQVAATKTVYVVATFGNY